MKSIMYEIPQTHPQGLCFICGTPADHIHHCWHGFANRRLADEDGLTVTMCWQCHTLLHDKGYCDDEIKLKAERRWINHYGKTEADFIARYGKTVLNGRGTDE